MLGEGKGKLVFGQLFWMELFKGRGNLGGGDEGIGDGSAGTDKQEQDSPALRGEQQGQEQQQLECRFP